MAQTREAAVKMLRSRKIESTLGVSNSRSLILGIGGTWRPLLSGAEGQRAGGRDSLRASSLWPSEGREQGGDCLSAITEGRACPGKLVLKDTALARKRPYSREKGRNCPEAQPLSCAPQYSPAREPCQDCWGAWGVWLSGRG